MVQITFRRTRGAMVVQHQVNESYETRQYEEAVTAVHETPRFTALVRRDV